MMQSLQIIVSIFASGYALIKVPHSCKRTRVRCKDVAIKNNCLLHKKITCLLNPKSGLQVSIWGGKGYQQTYFAISKRFYRIRVINILTIFGKVVEGVSKTK